MKNALKRWSLIALALGFSAAASCEESEPQVLHVYEYKPMYFLLGVTYTKIQLSLKTQIVKDLPLYFGYSQLMMWDLFTSSPFFHDLNYNPEFFYRWMLDPTRDRWLDFGPFDHESNGLGGANERSWNQFYIRYHMSKKLGEKCKLIYSFKLLYSYWFNPSNTDLPQYRGVWETEITLSNFLGPFFEFDDLSLRLYPGGTSYTDPTQGGQELTFRAKSAGRSFLPLFVMQLFHGYAENLLNYQENRFVFRAGFGF